MNWVAYLPAGCSKWALSHFLTTSADPYMNGDILVPFRY